MCQCQCQCMPAILTVYRYMVVIDTWIYNYQRQPLLHLLTWTKLLTFAHKHQIICGFYSITWSLWALSRKFYTSFFFIFQQISSTNDWITSHFFHFIFGFCFSWILTDWVYLVSSNTGDSHENTTFCDMRNWRRTRCNVEKNKKFKDRIQDCVFAKFLIFRGISESFFNLVGLSQVVITFCLASDVIYMANTLKCIVCIKKYFEIPVERFSWEIKIFISSIEDKRIMRCFQFKKNILLTRVKFHPQISLFSLQTLKNHDNIFFSIFSCHNCLNWWQ